MTTLRPFARVSERPLSGGKKRLDAAVSDLTPINIAASVPFKASLAW